MSEKASKNFAVKFSIGLYVLCIAGLIASYFAISTRQIQTAVYAQSSPHWVLGKTNYFRAAFLNVVNGRTYNKGTAILKTADEEILREPEFGYVSFDITPKNKSDNASLNFNVDDENLLIDFPIQVEEAEPFKLPKATERRSEEEKKQKVISEWEGKETIEIIPATGEIVKGLSNKVYFITRREGKAAKLSFQILKHEGVVSKLPKVITSNKFGVGSFDINPTTSLRLHLESTSEERSKGKVNLFAVSTQFNFETEKAYVPYGEMIRGRVESMRQSGAILVDAYEKERWVSGGVFGLNKTGGGFELKSSREGELMQVQVYHNFYRPGRSWASRWVAIGPSRNEGDFCDIFRKLSLSDDVKWASEISKTLPQTLPSSECKFLLNAYLSSLPISFVNSHTIVNSRDADQKELSEWKDAKKFQLKWITGVFLFGGLLFVFLLVLNGISRQREFQRELIDAGDGESLPEDRFEGFILYLGIATILIALGTFIASMLMVMSFM